MVFEGREAVKLFQESGVANTPTDALAIGNAFLRENENSTHDLTLPDTDGLSCVVFPVHPSSLRLLAVLLTGVLCLRVTMLCCFLLSVDKTRRNDGTFLCFLFSIPGLCSSRVLYGTS